MSNKSDVDAKQAFKKELESKGYEACITSAPADITATKNGETYYFEIKKTDKQDYYFGAATFTEWKQAFEDPEKYKFVIAQRDMKESDKYKFFEYTPEEFMQYSTIPPIKVYFRIPLNGNQRSKKGNGTKSLILTKQAFEKLLKVYDEELVFQKSLKKK